MNNRPIIPLIFIAASAFGSEPVALDVKHPGGPSIEVKETGTKNQVDTTWNSGYGSFDKSFSQRKQITATLTNMSSKPQKVSIDVLWIATKASDHSMKIISRHTFNANLGKAQYREIKDESPETNSTWLHLETIGENWMTGAKMGGWVVVVRDEARVCAFKASNQAGSELMANPSLLEKLLSAPGLPDAAPTDLL